MPLRFVNAGEGLEQYDTARTRGEERSWSRSVRERAMRDDEQHQSVDAALRESAAASSAPESSPPGPGLQRVQASAGETGAPAQTWRTPAIRKLAATPGGGRQAVTLMADEEKRAGEQRTARRAESREDRELAHRGLEQFNKFMDQGDVDGARVVNARFRLGIPEEAFANQRVLARLRGIATTLHRSGIRGETASEVFRAALENPDAPLEDALRSGMAAGAGRADRTDLIETEKGWYNLRTKQYETDAQGNNVMPTERRMQHAPRSTGGSGNGPRVQRTLEMADGSVQLIMSDGATQILKGEDGKPLKGAQAARRAAALVGKMISPIQTREERDAAVSEGVGISDRLGGTTAKPPAQRRPLGDFQR